MALTRGIYMMTAAKEHFLLASDLKGNRVVNKNAEDLGTLEDYMIDLQNGRIHMQCFLLEDGLAWAINYLLFPGMLLH